MRDAPAKGAALGSWKVFPMLPRWSERAPSLPLWANARRERADIRMNTKSLI